MTITFYLNILNHHQACVADELYSLLGEDFRFVELDNLGEAKGSTEDYSQRPYLIRAWQRATERDKADRLLETSDICVFGGVDALPYLTKRMEYGLPAFDISEHWLKRGLINILSPRLLKMLAAYYFLFRRKPLYKLCASAFAADDFKRLGVFKDRCYKWGYFTQINELDVDAILAAKASESSVIRIMWCARFIDWKHPEMPIRLAKCLFDNGIKVKIDMYGTGEMLPICHKLRRDLKVDDFVEFKGFMQNDQIIQAMQEHDIFIFTSDRNEGWGAVLNEAMSNCTAVVVSDKIGAAPYLVENGNNGLLFASGDIESLVEKVMILIEDQESRKKISVNAYKTMKNLWSPRKAAENLIHFSERILNGLDTDLLAGPCSKA